MSQIDSVRARSFGAVAHDYDRLRPRTPAEVIDWVLADGPATGLSTVVDLAAGTGALTEGLVGRAAHLVAVEPDDRMRAVLSARLPSVTALAGTADAIPLDDASADAVLVASAWHWFEPRAAFAEIGRVLRDGGVLGVLWNRRDRSTDWVRDLEDISRGTAESADDEASSDRGTPESRRRRVVEPQPDGPFEPAERRDFHWSRPMRPDELVELLGTYSGMIVASEDEREARFAVARKFLADRPDLAERGLIDVPHVTATWRMRRRGR